MPSKVPVVTATRSTARSANAARTRQNPRVLSSISVRGAKAPARPSCDDISSSCAESFSTAASISGGEVGESGLLLADRSSVSASAAALLSAGLSGAIRA
eukprot:scaffold245022_cov32-Tisochrysis_lutea.AAC.3